MKTDHSLNWGKQKYQTVFLHAYSYLTTVADTPEVIKICLCLLERTDGHNKVRGAVGLPVERWNEQGRMRGGVIAQSFI